MFARGHRLNTGRSILAVLAVSLLLSGVQLPAAAADEEQARVYLTVDKSQLVTPAQEPFSKVAVTNPNIADANVLSPNQILVHGKATGVTSLIVLYPNRVKQFDLVVNPAPAVGGHELPPAEPHAVLVHRADKVSRQLFARDRDKLWVELGSPRGEPEAAKK